MKTRTDIAIERLRAVVVGMPDFGCQECGADTADIAALLEKFDRLWAENVRLSADLERFCPHPSSYDSLPAVCCTCGKVLE